MLTRTASSTHLQNGRYRGERARQFGVAFPQTPPEHHASMRQSRRIALLLWASPYSALGCLIGVIGLATGGGARVLDGVVEFHGGFTRWVVRRTPLGDRCSAVTLGHTVIGQTLASLDLAHDHEMVHVRQFERWGPLMGPAYLGASAVVWIAGGRAYLDNPFEREAFGEEPPSCAMARDRL